MNKGILIGENSGVALTIMAPAKVGRTTIDSKGNTQTRLQEGTTYLKLFVSVLSETLFCIRLTRYFDKPYKLCGILQVFGVVLWKGNP